ncbi:MAG TPA: hypothetical protein VMX17_04670 [Candidatus Glassbacteria bacterium]|nr:hypothetical protein [Candidatus Glassbacteria bacterium]
MRHITHRDLWRIRWESLCRFARHLGLRVRNGPEGDRRGRLVEAIMARIVELELEDAARKGKIF